MKWPPAVNSTQFGNGRDYTSCDVQHIIMDVVAGNTSTKKAITKVRELFQGPCKHFVYDGEGGCAAPMGIWECHNKRCPNYIGKDKPFDVAVVDQLRMIADRVEQHYKDPFIAPNGKAEGLCLAVRGLRGIIKKMEGQHD